MNILVTGANGQLGSALRDVSHNTTHRYLFTDVAELDITDADAVTQMVVQQEVDVIVNCAAYTNVEQAENEPDVAEKLNATAVRNLAEAIKLRNGVLVHISTDYVFGGNHNNRPCAETEVTNPTGVYGATKLHGEQTITASGCRYIIIRTAWLYSEYGKNFVKTMLNLTATRDSVRVVFDQVGTPTYACDLAAAIYNIVEQRKYEGHEGIYHYSNEGVCSWYDLARWVAAYAGHTACDVQPCHSDEFPSKVVRPAYSVLDKTKIKETFGVAVPYWADSLKKCIANLQK